MLRNGSGLFHVLLCLAAQRKGMIIIMGTTFIKQVFIVLFKEFKYILRCKKTLLFIILAPLLLIPSLLSVLSYSMENMTRQVSNGMNISINDSENYLFDYLSRFSDVNIIETQNGKQDLKKGKILANIIIPSNFNELLLSEQNLEVIIETNSSSTKSQIATSKISEYLNTYSASYTREYLSEKGISSSCLNPISINLKNSSDEEKSSNETLNLILPMLIVLYCCIGSASIATDLTAGEKEKSTLESLLSTKAYRSAIVIGKWIITSLVSIISGLNSTLGIIGFIKLFPQQYKVSLSFKQVLIILVIIIMCSMLFSSINLSIGIYARNYKEAQTYLTPITFLLLIPSYLSYGLDVNDINITHLSIPILNIISVLKEILSDTFVANHIMFLILWLTLYIVLLFVLSIKLFKREKSIFRI